MKQYLPIILFLALIFSCSKKDAVEKDSELKQDKAITFDQAMRMIQNLKNSLQPPVTLSATPNKKTTTINFQSFYGYNSCGTPEKTANGVTLKATQGTSGVSVNTLNPQDYYSLYLSARHNYSDASPGSFGSGMVIQYPFKQGSIYTIKTFLTGTDAVYIGDSPTRRYPTLQARLTNNPTIQSICADSAPINLTGSSEPTQIFPAIEKGTTKPVTLTFTADKCYDYLWLSAIPNTTGKSLSTAELMSNLVIEEQNQFVVAGPESLTVNQTAT